MTSDTQIDHFLAQPAFAVVGASRDRSKYGNKVLRCYQQNGRTAYPVNPNADEIEGLACVPDLASLPNQVKAASIITPSKITEKIVEQAAEAGVQHLWMQPGAESKAAVERAAELKLQIIAGGPCILVTLGYHE